MSVVLEPPRAPREDPEALFREARMAARRRRRRRAGIVTLVVAALVGAGFVALGPLDGGSSGGRPPAAVRVKSVILPAAGRYSYLAVIGGRLVVSGGPNGSPLPSGYGDAGGRCDAASVNAGSLRLTPLVRRNCDDPALYGERVMAVNSVLSHTGPTGLVMGVRIARVDPSAARGYTVGPLLLRYDQCSDCRVQWTYGDGSLWIYGATTADGGVLLRVAEADGRLRQRLAMPSITSPLIAADADGFWLAPSVLSGFPLRVTRAQRSRFQSLYHVTPGSRSPVRVLAVGGGGARWLVASAHRLWLDISRPRGPSLLVALRGTRAAAATRSTYLAPTQFEYWLGASNFAGGPTAGVWSVLTDNGFNTGGAQLVVHLADGDGRAREVARVPLRPGVSDDNTSAVVFRGALYFLDPARSAANGYPHTPPRGALLYRVTP